jgi:hypothetical protein
MQKVENLFRPLPMEVKKFEIIIDDFTKMDFLSDDLINSFTRVVFELSN